MLILLSVLGLLLGYVLAALAFDVMEQSHCNAIRNELGINKKPIVLQLNKHSRHSGGK